MSKLRLIGVNGQRLFHIFYRLFKITPSRIYLAQRLIRSSILRIVRYRFLKSRSRLFTPLPAKKNHTQLKVRFSRVRLHLNRFPEYPFRPGMPSSAQLGIAQGQPYLTLWYLQGGHVVAPLESGEEPAPGGLVRQHRITRVSSA